MIRALLLRLLGGVPVEHHVAWTEHHMTTSGKVQGELRQRRDALHADLARVEAERDVERANANEWLAKYHDAERRIADLEAKLADIIRAIAEALRKERER